MLNHHSMSRFDTRTTLFSQEGRLHQVEYATKAVTRAGSALGILTKHGVVLATQKKIPSKLLDITRSDKIYKLDKHIVSAVAGLTSDANILIAEARISCQRWLYQFGEPIPVERLVEQIADHKQSYTQYGGLRPFGVSFLFAGWDPRRGYQLYQSDPSGNYSAWVAAAIGENHTSVAGSLKQQLQEVGDGDHIGGADISIDRGMQIAVEAIAKNVDLATLSSEKIEIVVFRMVDGVPSTDLIGDAQVNEICEAVKAASGAE
eukprot:gnl/Dysnectes_brevis/1733_a1972_2567.p1 GENE.gnl/Dysnectes_brevis/1733_a1972_2567~~gnl/Dysnectes_brevis/1733_a1972_2567.p1  ORF type:complete len:268 (+),score=59.72 gnl/Dysnectes_brevis/1733_a1972_2567:23-805(+)